EIAAAMSPTGVPADTALLDPSGSVTLTSLIKTSTIDLGLGAFAGLPTEAREAYRVRRRVACDAMADNLRLAPERRLVGAGGLEPLTSSVSGRRSNQLSYAPICCEFRI